MHKTKARRKSIQLSVPKKIANHATRRSPDKRLDTYTYIRLCFSGALAGSCVVGAVATLLGIAPSDHHHLAGAICGALAVAIGFKLARMV